MKVTINYLPASSRDGYYYGGRLILTIGELSLNLGGVNPDGRYSHEDITKYILTASEAYEGKDKP